MTTPGAASRYVVERCPRCGVEHEGSTSATCEACDTPLRAWCRAHSREIGWLDGAACHRCAREAAHPPRHRRASALPCPDFSAAAAGAAPRQVLDPLTPADTQPAPAAAGAPRPEAPVYIVERTVDWFWYAVALAYLMMFVICGGLTGLCVALLVGMDSPDVSTNFAIGGAASGAFLGLCYVASKRGTRWF